MKFPVYIAIAPILVTVGCHQIGSENIPTDAVQANMTVVAHQAGNVDVEASLRLVNEPLTYLELSPGETLTADSGGRAATMFPSLYGYRASLPPSPDGSLIRVGFFRSRFGSAPDSFVVLPDAFDPYLTTEATLDSDQIILEWDTVTNDAMSIRAEGTCMQPYEFEIQPFEDDGLHVIPAEALPVYEHWYGDDCQIEIRMDRIRSGYLDPALSGGTINAIQRRTTYLTIYR